MHELDIQIYDTPFAMARSAADISLSLEDKLRIARRLDDLAWRTSRAAGPAPTRKTWSFSAARRDDLAQRAHCRLWRHPESRDPTRERRQPPRPARREYPVCTVFGKLDPPRYRRPGAPPWKKFAYDRDSVAFLIAQGKEVIYDAEHYFDGYRADPDYALETLRAAARGGARMIVLCDTNGGSMPWEIGEFTRAAKEAVSTGIGIHTHNDGECAVANTLAAVREAPFTCRNDHGIGERCGNANLCSAIPDLELKHGLRCLPRASWLISMMSRTSSRSRQPDPQRAYGYVGVGLRPQRRRARTRHPEVVHSYQHIDPALVGNKMQVVVSELSGRANLFSKAEEYGVESATARASPGAARCEVDGVGGFSFEGAERLSS